MLEKITDKFENIFKGLRRQNRLTEKNIKDGVREIKLALLEADVNYKVVKELVVLIEQECLGEKVIKSVSPTDQFIKVVHDRLVEIMGNQATTVNLKKKGISVVLMVGLQGSGKTTSCAKLANYLKENKKVLLVGADSYRPAAKKQLRILSEECDVGYFTEDNNNNPVKICKKALKYAKENDYHCIIIDSAGRLEVDKPLMKELVKIKKETNPDEILFISDSMAGQSIVNTVKEFDYHLSITGVILSKFDSDTRGGAALSITKTTGKSIKFIGTGEKINNLELFHPDRIAGRILGKGDVISLVEKAQEAVDTDEILKTQKKILKNKFDLEDFLVQIRQIKRMGPLQNTMDMLPMGKSLKNNDVDEKQFVRTEAIILSMTPKERRNYRIINSSRRRRIAKGSGTKIQDVNRIIKQFENMQKMMKKIKNNPRFLTKMMGGNIPDFTKLKI